VAFLVQGWDSPALPNALHFCGRASRRAAPAVQERYFRSRRLAKCQRAADNSKRELGAKALLTAGCDCA
jgi:hypothetical protein